MIISLVVDPNCFEKSRIEDPILYSEARMLLGCIQQNGLLLFDPHGKLSGGLRERLEAMHIRYRQHIWIMFEEILKKGSRWAFEVKPDSIRENSTETEMVFAVASEASADAVVVDRDYRNRMLQVPEVSYEIVQLATYSYSRIETERRRYFQNLPSLHRLEHKDAEQAVMRIVKFAKRLCFYDRYIGTGKNIEAFRRGIDYILGLWKRHGWRYGENGEVKIITSPPKPIRSDESKHAKEEKQQENREAIQKVKEKLVYPLRSKYSELYIEFISSNPGDKRNHARFLQTDKATILFEGGFDLFERGRGPLRFKDNLLKFHNVDSRHLEEYLE